VLRERERVNDWPMTMTGGYWPLTNNDIQVSNTANDQKDCSLVHFSLSFSLWFLSSCLIIGYIDSSLFSIREECYCLSETHDEVLPAMIKQTHLAKITKQPLVLSLPASAIFSALFLHLSLSFFSVELCRLSIYLLSHRASGKSILIDLVCCCCCLGKGVSR